jgi:hypothetical protein
VLHAVQLKNNLKRNYSRDLFFDEQGTVTVTRNGTQTTLIVNQDKDEDDNWIKQLGQPPQP